jgi:hypothetical protein
MAREEATCFTRNTIDQKTCISWRLLSPYTFSTAPIMSKVSDYEIERSATKDSVPDNILLPIYIIYYVQIMSYTYFHGTINFCLSFTLL